MKKYILRNDTVTDENGQQHTVYGIDIPSQNISIPDIFCNRLRAENFVNTCNNLDLSPIHIFDVIEDTIA